MTTFRLITQNSSLGTINLASKHLIKLKRQPTALPNQKGQNKMSTKKYTKNNPLIAYKGFNNDRSCRGFSFELNKAYKVQNKRRIYCCKNGFHACENPNSIGSFYSFSNNGNIFGLVEQWGEIHHDGTKHSSQYIKVKKIFTQKEFDALLKLHQSTTFNRCDIYHEHNSSYDKVHNLVKGAIVVSKYYDAHCVSEAENSTIINFKKFTGSKGCTFIYTNIAAKVGEKGIKPNTPYIVKKGKFVEFKPRVRKKKAKAA